MKSIGNDWYKKIWSLDIKNQSWTENTKNQVDFIVNALNLKGDERILDLACGFGRHSIELAKRGYRVTGIDITSAYIDDAKITAREQGLNTEFLCMDIREIEFQNEFDVVLNLADGAVGYLENETENLKLFDVISKALKSGGKHFMDIMNADYADSHFPLKTWDNGKNGLTLSKFEWDKETRIMMYGQFDVSFGNIIENFELGGLPTRLYNIKEIKNILCQREITVVDVFSDYYGNPSSEDTMQLVVCSEKN